MSAKKKYEITNPIDWLPDWKNAKKYPQEKSIMWVWMWEFLRRNPQYQNDYAFFETNCLSKKNPSKAVKEKCFQMLEKYAITRMADPRLSFKKLSENSEYIFFESMIGNQFNPCMLYADNVVYEKGLIPESPSEFVIKFDLRFPLDFQIYWAKEQMEKMRICQKRKYNFKVYNFHFQPELFRDYLRILDANIHGVSMNEIAKVLYPDENNTYPDYSVKKKIEKKLKAAKKIWDTDYKYLFFTGYKKPKISPKQQKEQIVELIRKEKERLSKLKQP
jgi:hypothetical protein